MKAVWGEEYDWRKDKMYPCPVCPKCHEEVGKIQGKYRCFACGMEVELEPDMVEWFGEREETKTVMRDCLPDKVVDIDGKKIRMGCGGKGCVEVHMMRNPATLEWQTTGGECKKCGRSFIV